MDDKGEKEVEFPRHPMDNSSPLLERSMAKNPKLKRKMAIGQSSKQIQKSRKPNRQNKAPSTLCNELYRTSVQLRRLATAFCEEKHEGLSMMAKSMANTYAEMRDKLKRNGQL
jgi:hypothetical protein